MARQARSFLIRVRLAPTESEAREVLELALAGASLDVDLVVVFEGPGCGFLAPPWARGWRQLVDFDLARLYYLEDDELMEAHDSLAEPIALDALDRFCLERQVVDL